MAIERDRAGSLDFTITHRLEIRAVFDRVIPDDVFDQTQRADYASFVTSLSEQIAAYRRYVEGDHPANLTDEMRAALRIGSDVFDEFNDNYMDHIVQTLVDRITLKSMDSSPEAQDWVTAFWRRNRLDSLQDDVHEATVRDGNSYVMVYFDNLTRQARISHEQAFDGNTGLIPLYASTADRDPVACIKIWYSGERAYVNAYFADRVEHYLSIKGGTLELYERPGVPAIEPHTDRSGNPLGLPIIVFRNRSQARLPYIGRSEIRSAIPIQNALNRTMYSMVLAGELAAFGVWFAKGFEPPKGLKPGTWIKVGHFDENGKITAPVNADEAAALSAVDARLLEQAQITPYLDEARWLKTEISTVSRTPAPELMGGDSASGEALKQRESGLIGKVKRFHNRAGNSWEDVFTMAAALERAYAESGLAPDPAQMNLNAVWADPEIRNDKDFVASALSIRQAVGDRELLRLLSTVYGWNEEKIDQILSQRLTDQQVAIRAVTNAVPTLDTGELEF